MEVDVNGQTTGHESVDYDNFREELIRRFFNPKSFFFLKVSSRLQGIIERNEQADEEDYLIVGLVMDRLVGAREPEEVLAALTKFCRYEDFVSKLEDRLGFLQEQSLSMDEMKSVIEEIANTFADSTVRSIQDPLIRPQLNEYLGVETLKEEAAAAIADEVFEQDIEGSLDLESEDSSEDENPWTAGAEQLSGVTQPGNGIDETAFIAEPFWEEDEDTTHALFSDHESDDTAWGDTIVDKTSTDELFEDGSGTIPSDPFPIEKEEGTSDSVEPVELEKVSAPDAGPKAPPDTIELPVEEMPIEATHDDHAENEVDDAMPDTASSDAFEDVYVEDHHALFQHYFDEVGSELDELQRIEAQLRTPQGWTLIVDYHRALRNIAEMSALYGYDVVEGLTHKVLNVLRVLGQSDHPGMEVVDELARASAHIKTLWHGTDPPDTTINVAQRLQGLIDRLGGGPESRTSVFNEEMGSAAKAKEVDEQSLAKQEAVDPALSGATKPGDTDLEEETQGTESTGEEETAVHAEAGKQDEAWEEPDAPIDAETYNIADQITDSGAEGSETRSPIRLDEDPNLIQEDGFSLPGQDDPELAALISAVAHPDTDQSTHNGPGEDEDVAAAPEGENMPDAKRRTNGAAEPESKEMGPSFASSIEPLVAEVRKHLAAADAKGFGELVGVVDAIHEVAVKHIQSRPAAVLDSLLAMLRMRESKSSNITGQHVELITRTMNLISSPDADDVEFRRLSRDLAQAIEGAKDNGSFESDDNIDRTDLDPEERPEERDRGTNPFRLGAGEDDGSHEPDSPPPFRLGPRRG